MRTPSTTLLTDAWLLRGISSIPGELALSAGELSFSAYNSGTAWPWQLRKLELELGVNKIAQAMENGQKKIVFKWSIQELSYWVPWYYFGGGIKIKRGSQLIKLSFGSPVETSGLTNQPAEDLRQAAANFKEVGLMRGRGALWVAALSAAASSIRSDA